MANGPYSGDDSYIRWSNGQPVMYCGSCLREAAINQAEAVLRPPVTVIEGELRCLVHLSKHIHEIRNIESAIHRAMTANNDRTFKESL